eukprot:583829_1
MRTELDLYLSSPQIINESILSQIKETKGEPAEPYVSPQQQIINEWTTRHGRVTTKKIKNTTKKIKKKCHINILSAIPCDYSTFILVSNMDVLEDENLKCNDNDNGSDSTYTRTD